MWTTDAVNDWDTAPLFAELLDVLGPHRQRLREEVDRGAECTLTMVGEDLGLVVTTLEQANEHGWYSGEDSDFVPFLAADRIEIWLTHDALQFLVDVHATFGTHIDVDLRDP